MGARHQRRPRRVVSSRTTRPPGASSAGGRSAGARRSPAPGSGGRRPRRWRRRSERLDRKVPARAAGRSRRRRRPRRPRTGAARRRSSRPSDRRGRRGTGKAERRSRGAPRPRPGRRIAGPACRSPRAAARSRPPARPPGARHRSRRGAPHSRVVESGGSRSCRRERYQPRGAGPTVPRNGQGRPKAALANEFRRRPTLQAVAHQVPSAQSGLTFCSGSEEVYPACNDHRKAGETASTPAHPQNYIAAVDVHTESEIKTSGYYVLVLLHAFTLPHPAYRPGRLPGPLLP